MQNTMQMRELTTAEVESVNGGDTCTTAYGMAGSWLGGTLGALSPTLGAGIWAGVQIGGAAGVALGAYLC